ncbi:hypothetical protein KIN20_028811 [Parelaphostrongylus tenuis]|uniref:Uncharacterized protein n=1 Tax=Parelaphostrongylus tenuis TaxID=148309 RepID=A0AAD5R1T1_PARTN|nr:hypothetical protein KIN20_028811 [Parelaphostrongylus tenuis]
MQREFRSSKWEKGTENLTCGNGRECNAPLCTSGCWRSLGWTHSRPDDSRWTIDVNRENFEMFGDLIRCNFFTNSLQEGHDVQIEVEGSIDIDEPKLGRPAAENREYDCPHFEE